MESCNLLSKLNEEKYGSCPTINDANIGQCTHQSRSASIAAALKINGHESLASKLISNSPVQDLDDEIASSMAACSRDSDCIEIKKCCVLNPGCPEHGNVCLRPSINSTNLPSIPHNLTIVERKKGKTVILSWDSSYNKNKPTIFVVEGRWSLRPPDSSHFDQFTPSADLSMTKWGYLAQTVNNNWIILRNINRGRWYKFRVAAISKSGTLGHSASTDLFILSSAPKPPSNPQNLSVAQIYPGSDDNRVNVDLTWLPPKRSDLPVNDYKITWRIKKPNKSDSDEDYPDEASTEYLDAQSLNRFTIKNLIKSSLYIVDLVAVSKNGKETLVSGSVSTKIDTSQIQVFALSSPLIAAETNVNTSNRPSKNDLSNHSEDDDDEDDEIDEDRFKSIQSDTFIKHEPPVSQKPSEDESLVLKRPSISNLTVQTPFFQNGLVKAKLAWQLDQKSQSSNNQASIINSVIDPPMFTITWFAIKCVKLVSNDATQTYATVPPKQLPTLITATTINTHFEIYELKYNCDYVVNVRLAKLSSSASINQRGQSNQPQIASVQFKVPACNMIGIIGRIRPICYTYNSAFKVLDQSTTRSTTDLFTGFKSTTKERTTTSTPTTTTNNMAITLPKVLNIRHRIVDRNKASKLYMVEFSWSLPFTFNKKSFGGYQISIVPKAIPGFSLFQAVDDESGFRSFGSVGAIVDKDQNLFVARQLRDSVKYIFQIQLIGTDNQSYGAPSSLEFMISNDDSSDNSDDDTSKYPKLNHDLRSMVLKNNGFESYDDSDPSLTASLESSSSSSPRSILSCPYFFQILCFFIFSYFLLNELNKAEFT